MKRMKRVDRKTEAIKNWEELLAASGAANARSAASTGGQPGDAASASSSPPPAIAPPATAAQAALSAADSCGAVESAFVFADVSSSALPPPLLLALPPTLKNTPGVTDAMSTAERREGAAGRGLQGMRGRDWIEG